MAPTREITLETLQSMFHLPEKQVASELGICLTSLKKQARNLGITRWPFRKINRLKSLEASMKKMNADTSSLSSIALAYATKGTNIPKSLPAIPVHTEMSSAEKEEDAVATRRSPIEDEDETPSCSLSKTDVLITNWSSLWTVKGLKRNVLTPLDGTELAISSDGILATVSCPTKAVAEKAQNIVRKACDAWTSSVSSEVSSPAEDSDAAEEQNKDEKDEEDKQKEEKEREQEEQEETVPSDFLRHSSSSFMQMLVTPTNSRPSSMTLLSPASSRPSSMTLMLSPCSSRPSSMEFFRPSSMEFSDMMHSGVLLC